MNKTVKNGNQQGAVRRPGTRRLVQLYAALLYNANLKGFIDGHIYSGNMKAVCVPGLNCYSCPGAIASCPLGSLQNALNAAGHTAPWYVLGILALFGVILGRTVCGWICPLGLLQELLHRIPTPKIRKSRITRKLSNLKYVFLAVFVVAVPLFYGIGRDVILPAFCKYICPAGTFEGAVGLLQNPANATSFFQLGAVFTSKWVVMLVIFLACVFCYRSFCRFVCPLGAIYGFFNRFALTGIKVNPDRCVGCGVCVMKCPMDVKHVGDHECISCGKCVSACTQGAISLKCGKITLKGPETGRNADPESSIRKRRKAGRIAWGIAVAVLVFAVVWFNFIEPSDGFSPVGTEIGDLLPDFSTDLLSGENFRLSDHRGQVVIINFWGTTCEPCIVEMPFYEQLKASHPDVEILAIHTRVGAEKAKEFLKGKGWDHLDFAVDSSEKGIMKLLNAPDALPSTIVVDAQGVITYYAQAPLTLEKLEVLYENALGALPESGSSPEPEAEGAADGACRIFVTDEEGRPLAKVMMQFCDESSCRLGETNESGCAVFSVPVAKTYEVHILSVPDGYAFDMEEIFYTDQNASDMTIVLKKEE